jgi:hypothetical protein
MLTCLLEDLLTLARRNALPHIPQNHRRPKRANASSKLSDSSHNRIVPFFIYLPQTSKQRADVNAL